MSHLMNTYGRLPVAFARGEGCRLTDTEGRTYLDALAGIAVNTLGHAHPALVAALSGQAGRLMHVSNLYRIPEQEALADALAERSGLSEAFFCNSGCEANEAAIKLARFYGHRKGIDAPGIAVLEGAFHGRTLATLSATGNRKVQAGFEPLVNGFTRIPRNDIAALRAVADTRPGIVAVMLEVIQGEGGIEIISDDFLKGARALCDEKGWLLICDEVQCGMARTGQWFGFQHAGILPDIVTLAKGLGSGVPIGACLAGGKAAGLFGPGNHGSTFGGNPLAATAALKTIEIIEAEGLLEKAARTGEQIRGALAEALDGISGVKEIRGRGLMIGIALDRPCGALVQAALDQGLLINVTHERVIRLLPPLIFGPDEVRELVGKLAPLICDFLDDSHRRIP
ncbi:MAG: aspartate aminotransferase family protein [Zoogloeaceae bacterium]|jgi:acetylornithine aminotransferase|nr:aspartate aminotransferase family protein [Zoogloeaceae bacterium]